MGIDTAILIGVDERAIPPLEQRTIVLRLVGTYAFMMIALKSFQALRRPSIIWLLRCQDCVNELKFRVAKFSFSEAGHFIIDLIKQVFETVGSLIAHTLKLQGFLSFRLTCF